MKTLLADVAAIAAVSTLLAQGVARDEAIKNVVAAIKPPQ